MGGLLHLVQRGGDWAGPQHARLLHAVPNVTAHPSTASVPITVLLYNGPLRCSFNVAIIKGYLTDAHCRRQLCYSMRCLHVLGAFPLITKLTHAHTLDSLVIYTNPYVCESNKQHTPLLANCYRMEYKKLSCHRETARCVMSSNISLSHSR